MVDLIPVLKCRNNFPDFARLLGVFLLIFGIFVQSVHGFIRCKNGIFSNENGKEIFFKGVGLGGWLVAEGYMLHFPGYGSPTSINAQVVDVIGEQNAQLFWKNYRQNYVNRQDIARIAELGYNSIRLPFNYRLLSPEDQPGVYLEDGFGLLDQFIDWCSEYHLYVILDMHCAPGGQNADNISDSDGQEARLWTETSNQDRTVDIWQHIAQRYANDTTIVGYDLLNEPVLPNGHSATELRNLYIRITNAIREVDENHIIFIEGNWYATDFTSLTPPWETNMAYSFHKYWNDPSAATIQNYLNIRKTYRIPFWMGESGENSNHWFASVVKMLQDNDVSWCWWTHKKFETTTSPFSAQLPNGFQTLVNYWNGQGSKPSESFALSILMLFTENLKLEKCTYHPDVIQALFDSSFLTQSHSFTVLTIPGKINCVDYDFGGNNVAYSDKDFERIRYDQYTPWNQGGQYRNDGVDIEKSNDAQGPEYSIGWIESGEWVAYSVQVASAGNYELHLRIASISDAGRLQLLDDNKPLTNVVSIPKTGGWYNWDTVKIEGITMQAGLHKLVLKFINSGFNIDQMEFVKISGAGSINKIPQNFELGQNYPNPFNQSTCIPYYLQEKKTVRLEIVDLSGNVIFSDVTNGHQGQDFFYWNGHDQKNKPISSGIYFYRIKAGNRWKTKKMVCLR